MEQLELYDDAPDTLEYKGTTYGLFSKLTGLCGGCAFRFENCANIKGAARCTRHLDKVWVEIKRSEVE